MGCSAHSTDCHVRFVKNFQLKQGRNPVPDINQNLQIIAKMVYFEYELDGRNTG